MVGVVGPGLPRCRIAEDNVEGPVSEWTELGGRGERQVDLEEFAEEERAVGGSAGPQVEVVYRTEFGVDEFTPLVQCLGDVVTPGHAEEQVDVRPAVLAAAGSRAGDRGADDALVIAGSLEQLRAHLLATGHREHISTLGDDADTRVSWLARAVPNLIWRLRWEADLSTADHDSLSALLLRVYPMHDKTFRDGRSWSGAIPEARVIGYDGARPVAHLGFLRRQLRIDDGAASVLVGDAGLVGVDPDFRGSGVGLQLLTECATALQGLALPFGFLTCGPDVVPFYERGGWQLLPGQVTRMIDNDLRPETYTGPALALPVTAGIEQWPTGHTVVRDGLEV